MLAEPGLIAASLAALFACAAVAPPLFWLLLAGMLAAGVALLVFRHAPVASAVWLLLAGATLEMTLCDLIGPEAFQPTIALVKGWGSCWRRLLCCATGQRVTRSTRASPSS